MLLLIYTIVKRYDAQIQMAALLTTYQRLRPEFSLHFSIKKNSSDFYKISIV